MSDIDYSVFTPTERRILDVLADGEPHTYADLLPVLDDDMAAPSAMRQHISRLRDKLNPQGEEIVSQCFGIYNAYRRFKMLRITSE
jgi:hypothetical protein